jgi:hypothetical protein
MDLSSLLTAGVVCGGMGSLTGPFVATALFVVVPELFRGLALWRLVLYGVLLVVIMNLRPKGLYGHEELSLGNLPKLFLIVGLTVGLTVGASIYNTYSPEWGGIPSLLLAALLGLGVTVAMNYAGRGLARLLQPVLPSLGATWDRGFNSVVRHFDGLFTPRERTAGTAGALDPGPQANAAAADKPLLSIRGLCKHFGGVIAVDGVDLDVWPGQIVGLIGPNAPARRRSSI